MPSMILECPHCGAEKIGFNIVYDIHSSRAKPGSWLYRTLMMCSGCDGPVVGVFEKPQSGGAPGAPQQCNLDPRLQGFSLLETFPRHSPSKCPDHTPDGLKRIFLQSANALKRGDPDASGAMSRKVIDVSTQSLLADEAKNHSNIYARIEALAAKGKLTPELKDWAHEVRLGGADAAHDLDPFTSEEAEELLEFAELYLIYVYSLPERLRLRREKAAAEKAAKVS